MAKEKIKYTIKQNNYVGLLFFALVLAASLYIIKHETETLKPPTETFNAIEPETIINDKKEVIFEENEEIKKLRNYLNKGDQNNFKIYQSMYNNEEKVTIDNMNEETMLYIAYKNIINTNDLSKYIKYLTCDEATLVGIENEFYQCGGGIKNLTTYTVNTYITKDLLNTTVKSIFNVNIQNFKNFYTSEDNLCYFINEEYLCISKKNKLPETKTEVKFIKVNKYNNKIEIIENFKHIKDGIHYNGFNSEEVGEGTYISTFTKQNGKYYWISTEYSKETS